MSWGCFIEKGGPPKRLVLPPKNREFGALILILLSLPSWLSMFCLFALCLTFLGGFILFCQGFGDLQRNASSLSGGGQ